MSAAGGDTGPYELVYAPLQVGPAYAFPCSAEGVVNLDQLSERARSNYLMARSLVGRDFLSPIVRSIVRG